MDRKIIVIATASVAVLAIAFAYVVTMKPATSTALYVSPQTVQGTVGQNFTVDINVSNAADLYAWQLKLSWNATMLDAVNVTEGVFLNNGGNNTFFSPLLNNTAGYFLADCTLLGDTSGVSGQGVLVTIQFYVKASGACGLSLDNTVLINTSVQTITHTVTSGHFSTQTSLELDYSFFS